MPPSTGNIKCKRYAAHRHGLKTYSTHNLREWEQLCFICSSSSEQADTMYSCSEPQPATDFGLPRHPPMMKTNLTINANFKMHSRIKSTKMYHSEIDSVFEKYLKRTI